MSHLDIESACASVKDPKSNNVRPSVLINEELTHRPCVCNCDIDSGAFNIFKRSLSITYSLQRSEVWGILIILSTLDFFPEI